MKHGIVSAFAATVCVAAGNALAHPGPGLSGEHTPFDHFLAMGALGLWAVVLGGAALYAAKRLAAKRSARQEARQDRR